MPDGMPMGGRIEVLGMRPAIHKNNSKRVGTAYIEDIHPFQIGQMQKLYAVRSLKTEAQPRRDDMACAVRVHGSGGHRRALWPTAEMELFQRAPELPDARGRHDPAAATVHAPGS